MTHSQVEKCELEKYAWVSCPTAVRTITSALDDERREAPNVECH